MDNPSHFWMLLKIWIQLIYRLDVVSAKLMNINYSGSSIGETRRQKMVFLFLPQEIIIEILLRLPVKSLPSFKFVCKSWLSLISNPHFAKWHFERNAAHTEKLLFVNPSWVPKVQSFMTIRLVLPPQTLFSLDRN